jgi:signal transduction histidine kinase/CheY-like chemotaxis protein
MHFIKSNLDFIIVISLICSLFFWSNFLPLRQKWTKINFVYLSMLLLYSIISWEGIRLVELQASRAQMEKLLGYAPSYAITFERLGHSKIGFNTSAEDPLYLKLIEFEKAWQSANPFIADIYTMKKDGSGKVSFLVDSETDYDRSGFYDGEREARTKIGEVFQKDLPELENAFNGRASFTHEPYTDKWGSWVSAFVPLRNEMKQIDGVLGVDFPSDVYLSNIKSQRYLAFGGFTLFFILLTGYISIKQYHRQYRLKLTAALSESKQAADVKARFLANMSHEFRTPLNAIIGNISLLAFGSLDEESKKKVSIIQFCCDNLLVLINDILDFSKIESGKLIFESVEFKIDEAVQEIVELFRASASEKGLAINFEIGKGDLPSWISADLTRIRQILLNLITNAIKFTPQGSVTVKLLCHDLNSEECEIKLSVSDTGIGIDLEAQSKLFQSFSQVDASTTRRFGGTGLGLAISKGIIEAMGGKIWVESAPAEGSTFSIKFCAKRVLNSTDMRKKKIQYFDSKMAERKPLRILIADDQMPNRLLASNFLKLLGYNVVTACNGLEVLDAFNTNFYDVVFMDCQMPEMDGFSTTMKLRKRYVKEKSPWIIAFTASAYAEDREKCIQAGMDDFITKPFSVETLARSLEKVNLPPQIESSKLGLQNQAQTADTPILDKNLVQRHFLGDQNVLVVVIDDFIKSFPLALTQIQAAIEKEDLKEIRFIAHKLRGKVANFYAKPIQNNLLTLETMARNNDLDKVAELYLTIKLQMEKLKNELETIDFGKAS